MGPLFLNVIGGIAAAAAQHLFTHAGSSKPKALPGASPGETKGKNNMGPYDNNDDEVGADDIYIETAGDGDEDEVGAARSRPRARTKRGRTAYRRIAFVPNTAIAAGATSVLQVVLNSPFKGMGLVMEGLNVDDLLFNGATIRGKPQEGSSGSVGCNAFQPNNTFFWEWDTANPGESFTLSFTNTNAGAVTPRGYMLGYLAP
jgi:hypothetical protein